MSDIAICAEKLGKSYRIKGQQRNIYSTLRESLMDAVVSPFRGHGDSNGYRDFLALQNLSFEIKQGEVLGIIGRNGAGKSTLLKILSRITEPTTGFADIQGRVASLLEVGTGFHPELSGRDNIYLNGAILGMKKTEIGRKFDEIVAFAEVEKFIETPVKHYSSGMYLRLAFAVAAHLEPEILLIDEVLAVGDAGFQKKCLGKMGEVAKAGRTVLFVSHNIGAIVQLCTRALWLDSGAMKLSGSPSEVATAYLSTETITGSSWTPPSDGDEQLVQMRLVRVLTKDNQASAVVRFDQPFKIEIDYRILDSVRNLFLLCRLTDSQGNVIWTSWDTDATEWKSRVREPGLYCSVCTVPKNLIRPGRYLLSVGASDLAKSQYYENVLAFDISEVGFKLNTDRIGAITPVFEWSVSRETADGKNRPRVDLKRENWGNA